MIHIKKILAYISNYIDVVNLRNNKRIVVFLVCLLIATSLWLLNALGKDYSTVISHPIRFENPPENQFLAGDVPEKLDLEVNGNGYTLFRLKLLSFSAVRFNIQDITSNLESSSGNYRISSRNLRTRIEDQLSNELSISHISPEILLITLDSLSTKRIPVKLDINVDYEPQHNLKSPIRIYPELVNITGPTTLLRRVSVLRTKVNITNQLSSDFKQEIELIPPDKTRLSPAKVMLDIEVEKYTEKELKIPIEVLNSPIGANIKLFPSEVKVIFKVGLSRFENISESDFRATVDYSSIENNANNLEIILSEKPEFIEGTRLNPERVEFLIETNQ